WGRRCWWSDTDSGPWWLNCGDPTEAESCGDRSRPLTDGPQKRVARSPHTTHDFHQTKICYRCHPSCGVEVEVIRYLRRIDPAILIVRLPSGKQVALPDWMLSPQVCDGFTNEAEPRISIQALFDLRRLIDANRVEKTAKGHGCAESPSGGKNVQQRNSVQVATQAALRGRRDLDRASRIGEGTVPNSVAPGSRKRSQDRQRETE